jgi:hypothetical protein
MLDRPAMAEPIDLARQIACVRREVSMRKRVYPRWVQNSKMTQEEADRQIATMEAVQATLEQLHADEKTRTAPGLF